MNLSPDTHSAADVIRLLALEPLPHEGGWFRRTGEAATFTPDGRRSWSTALVLFTPDSFSALHRLGADEVWCHQAGDALETLALASDGTGARHLLGADVATGGVLQVVMPAGVWQGAQLADGGHWALVCCVVIPEFRWSEFSLGCRSDLEASHPDWVELIRGLTRES